MAGKDLDLYVEVRYAIAVAWFLEKAGYQFYKRGNQASSWRAQLMNPQNLGTEELDAGEPDIGSYLGRGIQDVLDFYLGPEDVPLDQRKQAQMITAKCSPMDIILAYHSSEYNRTEDCSQHTDSLVS